MKRSALSKEKKPAKLKRALATQLRDEGPMQHWTHEQKIKHRAEAIGLNVRMRESGQMQFTGTGEVLTGWMLPEDSLDWLVAREKDWAIDQIATGF